MRRDPRAYLWDMREAAALALRFVAGRTFSEYLGDDLRRSAVERQMQNIGEALSQLSKTDPQLASQFESRAQIIGFRNILVHGYAALDHARVWETVHSDLHALQTRVNALLSTLDPTDKA